MVLSHARMPIPPRRRCIFSVRKRTIIVIPAEAGIQTLESPGFPIKSGMTLRMSLYKFNNLFKNRRFMFREVSENFPIN